MEHPDQKPDPINSGNVLILSTMTAQIQVLREVLCKLLAKEPSILQGQSPEDYIEAKIGSQMNTLLAGMADHDPKAASLLAKFLLPPKPPTSE